MKKTFMKSVILFSVCAGLFTNFKLAYADEHNEIVKKVYIPSNIGYTINGGNINLNSDINDEGNFEVHAEIDTKNLDDGYYTAFIYENGRKNWSAYDGILFKFENLGTQSIDLNVDFINSSQDDYKVTDNKTIYIQNNSNDILSQTKTVNGVIKINDKFSGNIIIPFDSLESKNKEGVMNSTDIALWGIDLTIPDNNVRHFVISDFSLVSFNKNFKTYMNNNFVINGDNEVVIPNEGEFIYLYNVLKNPSKSDLSSNNFYKDYNNEYDNVEFTLGVDDIDGVSITKEGILTVSNNVTPRTITVIASIIEQNFAQGLKVDLVNSNEYGVVNNNISIDIPKVDNLSNNINVLEFLINNKFINIFRAFIILGVVSYFAIIIMWRRIGVVRR